MNEASFYTRDRELSLRCELCPHNCLIREGQKGICKVRYNQRGRLYSSVYGYPAAMHSDPIEKKPFYHYYPGKQVFSIGTRGCNLHCDFCQNAGISMYGEEGEKNLHFYQPCEIVNLAEEVPNNAGIAFTYNEPVVFFEYMFDIALIAKGRDMKTLVVTNGYINQGPLESLLRVSDAFNIDLKAFSSDAYRRYTGGSPEPVKETIKMVRKNGKHLELTHLVVPGMNDPVDIFSEMVKWIAGETGPDTPLHISRYFPHYKMDGPPTSMKTLQEFYEIASEKLSYVYLGNVPTDEGQNTLCPRCGTKVIKRSGYHADLSALTEEGRCRACGAFIAETQAN